MNRILIAIAVLAVTVLPSFAADVPALDLNRTTPEMRGSTPDMRVTPEMRGSAPGGTADVKDVKGMPPHHGMKKEMMRNPQHLLMMAYHKNVLSFGHMLEKVAKQGETVPGSFARTALAEMRRSTDEMEKYRAGAMRDMPAEMKHHGDMKKMMDEHLVNVKTHLRQLEDLSKSDRIPSQEVIKHLDAIFEECEGMGCGKMGGRHGEMMHHDGKHHHEGMHHKGMMHGKGHGCQCVNCEDMDEDED